MRILQPGRSLERIIGKGVLGRNIKQLQLDIALRGFSGRQFVISTCKYGLCNRIKCLISSMRLAERLSRKLALYWEENPLCKCMFSDLFENDTPMVNKNQLAALADISEKFKSDQWYIVATWSLMTLPDEVQKKFVEGYKSVGIENIDHRFEKIPWSVRNNYLAYFNSLVPAEYIRKEVSDFSGQFDGKTISVHVRSWHQDSKEWSRTFSLEKVYEALDKEDGSIFFICCDSDEVLRKIRLRYGSRTISYPARTFAGDKGSRIGMQDALIQLLLLSKNSRHIITPGSTYSEIAWWLGGCRASVGRIARHTKNSIPG